MGAGIAGLVAADALSRHGATVLLHEARDRVGGRLHSAATPGGAIDLGATWFWPDEPLVHALADQLGLATFAQHVHGDALFEAGGGGPRRLDGNPIDTPSARFTDGAQGLARALASRLPSGTLRLGEPVLALTAADDGIRVDAGARSVHAKDVILAVPPALVVEGIRFDPPLPADVRRAASSTAVWMGGVTKAVAVYAEAFWRAQGLSGSAISYRGPFRELHDHSGPGATPAALFAFAPSAALGGLTADAIDAAFREQLVRLLGPEAADVQATHVLDWSGEAFTAPSHPDPGASTRTFGAPIFQRPAHGRIHWASTETARTHAGHIEGAIGAGRRAAEHVLARRGTPQD